MHPLVMSLNSCDVILYSYITIATKLNSNRFILVYEYICMFVATVCSYVCTVHMFVCIRTYTIVQKLFDKNSLIIKFKVKYFVNT